MISHISYSSLSMAMRCGEQFRRRYMKGEIIPPAVAMGMGRGLHKAAELNFRQKVTSKVDMPVNDMLDAARDGYVETFKNGVYLAPDERGKKNKLLDEGLDNSIRLTRLHREQAAPRIQPAEVEKRFEYDIGLDLPIMGYIDLITENKEIIDHKATKRSWPTGKIETDLQPVFYTWAYKRMEKDILPPMFKFMIHVALKTPKLQVQEWIVNDNQEQALLHRITAVIKMISAGAFIPANPTDWVCSPRWCGYYQTCKYVGNGKPSTWV